jgi:hypothetical protein
LLREQGWQVDACTQQSALEEVVKRVKSPKVLHVATHGFFEPNQVSEPGDQAADEPSGNEDPMLRSGLYFAGAKRMLTGHSSIDLEDGFMNAFEATRGQGCVPEGTVSLTQQNRDRAVKILPDRKVRDSVFVEVRYVNRCLMQI